MKSHKLTNLSLELEEDIYNSLEQFLDANPQWNRNCVINVSLALFLEQECNKITLDNNTIRKINCADSQSSSIKSLRDSCFNLR